MWGMNIREVLIHVMALRVDTGQLDFHPIAGRRGTQRTQAVAGTAFDLDPAFGLRLIECIHQQLMIADPGGRGRAMNQQAVNVINAQFTAVTVNGAHRIGQRLFFNGQF